MICELTIASAATDEFGYALEAFFRTSRRMRARTATNGIAGLSLPQYHLLEALADEQALAVGALAEAAGVTAPTATRMFDGLVRDGFVERRHSETDRRVVLVSLTAKGRTSVRQARTLLHAWRQRMFDGLTPEERAEGARFLTRLNALLEEQML